MVLDVKGPTVPVKPAAKMMRSANGHRPAGVMRVKSPRVSPVLTATDIAFGPGAWTFRSGKAVIVERCALLWQARYFSCLHPCKAGRRQVHVPYSGRSLQAWLPVSGYTLEQNPTLSEKFKRTWNFPIMDLSADNVRKIHGSD